MTTEGDKDLVTAAKVANTIAGPSSNTVTLKDGKEVEIYVCKAKNVGIVLTAAIDIMENMGIKTLGEVPETDFTNPSIFLKLIAKSSESVFTVVSELCSIELGELLELELDDVLIIILQVVTLNKDFFLRKLLPLLPSELRQSPAKPPTRRKRK